MLIMLGQVLPVQKVVNPVIHAYPKTAVPVNRTIQD